MKKKVIFLLLFIALIMVLLNGSYVKSLFVMGIYSTYHNVHSLMHEKDITIEMPGGTSTLKKDWYPFVMIFNDRSFRSIVGEDIDLTILYNFGAFKDGRSTIYDENSDYYNSFYGAYVVSDEEQGRSYGFERGQIQEEEISVLASHDIKNLVLRSIGCSEPQVEFQSLEKPKQVDYLSYDNWIRIDTSIYANSSIHKYHEEHIAYIQYGKPPKHYTGSDFPKITLLGRMYCRYFPEYDVTILLYIIAPNNQVIEETDREILSNTKIFAKE